MPLDITPGARSANADVMPDDGNVTGAYGLSPVPPVRASSATAADPANGHTFSALEEAAHIAIDTVTNDAERRISAAIESAESRVVDALTLNEQHQHELKRWRDETEERLRATLRELSEWDETLSEMRTGMSGMREMAEASISLASGELDQRWDALRGELNDVLATAESDERARWETFMSSVTDSLAVGSDGDPAALEEIRADIAVLRDSVTKTISNFQQMQREQIASLRSEMHSLLESERGRSAHLIETRLGEAQRAFQTHSAALREWQQNVGRDVAGLREMAETADARVREATAQLQAESQVALHAIRVEIQNGVAQARAAAQAEMGGARVESTQAIRKVQRQVQAWQSLALVIAVIAFVIGSGAFAVAFLHLH